MFIKKVLRNYYVVVCRHRERKRKEMRPHNSTSLTRPTMLHTHTRHVHTHRRMIFHMRLIQDLLDRFCISSVTVRIKGSASTRNGFRVHACVCVCVDCRFNGLTQMHECANYTNIQISCVHSVVCCCCGWVYTWHVWTYFLVLLWYTRQTFSQCPSILHSTYYTLSIQICE